MLHVWYDNDTVFIFSTYTSAYQCRDVILWRIEKNIFPFAISFTSRKCSKIQTVLLCKYSEFSESPKFNHIDSNLVKYSVDRCCIFDAIRKTLIATLLANDCVASLLANRIHCAHTHPHNGIFHHRSTHSQRIYLMCHVINKITAGGSSELWVWSMWNQTFGIRDIDWAENPCMEISVAKTENIVKQWARSTHVLSTTQIYVLVRRAFQIAPKKCSAICSYTHHSAPHINTNINRRQPNAWLIYFPFLQLCFSKYIRV